MLTFPLDLKRYWITEQLRCEFRTVPGAGQFPAISNGGTAIWRPPRRAYLRAVIYVVDLGDILVAAGGATALRCGIMTNGLFITGVWTGDVGTANVNAAGGAGTGWLQSTQGAAGAPNRPTQLKDGCVMWAANQLWPGETQGERALAVATDVVGGTYTGTLLFTIQWVPF